LRASQQRNQRRCHLTNRELDVLRCINQDLTNQQIAEALVIEVRTVKHHVHSILYKLKLSHRWEAGRVAAERGWLSLESLPDVDPGTRR
jgi:DNA-binding NarL/FixJ family response regulator